MNSIISQQLRVSVDGRRAPITVRSLAVPGLAAPALARGGSIDVDTIRARERAVSWLALALLLGAWNVEARLDGGAPACDSAGSGARPERSAVAGLDWTNPRPTRWTSTAGRAPAAREPGT